MDMRFGPVPEKARLFLRSECGATAIEYAMIVCLVFLAIVGGVTALGRGIVDTLYNRIAAAL
jgi:Flp pilus assembly pilin Flp